MNGFWKHFFVKKNTNKVLNELWLAQRLKKEEKAKLNKTNN